jgi:L-threonylcarbamoyladenylate synthase
MEKPVTGYLDRRVMRTVADLLRGGAVAVLPTDTLYGFHCLASNTASIVKIVHLKGRSGGSGFILLASGVEMADALVDSWPFESRSMLNGVWPAPLTAILPGAERVPDVLTPGGTVALRVPDHAALRELISIVGEPLVSTSVNRSGSDPLMRIDEIRAGFPGLAAYCSQRGRGRVLPSTIVDFTRSPPRLIRTGRFPWPPR